MKIATYEINQSDVDQINKFSLPLTVLRKSPWIQSPWLFPTWVEVNKHLNLVAERATKRVGTFRAWSPVQIDERSSPEHGISAVRNIYTSSTFVTSKFTSPLPFIDFFLGKIVCLQKNWNPTWNLFNNAKGLVVGIICQNEKRRLNPLMFLNEALQTTIRSHEALKYSLLIKPFLPFIGPSAISDIPGIIEVPWVKVSRKICNCTVHIYGPQVYPANAFSHHQSQGSTFDRCVTSINDKCKSYGMANVVTSKTSKPTNFALTSPVTLKMLQPAPHMSNLVESEYQRLSQN